MYDVLVGIFWVYSTATKCKCFTKTGLPDSWFFDSYNENKVTQLLLHKRDINYFKIINNVLVRSGKCRSWK